MLLQVLSELSPFQRDRGAQQMLANGYIRRLLDVFRVGVTDLYVLVTQALCFW
jgi:hypothetical protein